MGLLGNNRKIPLLHFTQSNLIKLLSLKAGVIMSSHAKQNFPKYAFCG